MSSRSAVFVLVASMLATGSAQGASDADTLAAFSLLGESAVDCKAPPSRDNPHVVFGDSRVGLAEILKTGPAELDEAYPLRAAKILDRARISMEIEGSTEKLSKIIIVKSGKVWHTESSEIDGRMLIKDGRLASRGTEIPRFERCDGR